MIRAELENAERYGNVLERLSRSDVPKDARDLALSAPIAPQHRLLRLAVSPPIACPVLLSG